jgi:hypothetical protein
MNAGSSLSQPDTAYVRFPWGTRVWLLWMFATLRRRPRCPRPLRAFGRPEELAERLEASGYDISVSEIEAGIELHLPCLLKVGKGNHGYKSIEEFLLEAAECPAATST